MRPAAPLALLLSAASAASAGEAGPPACRLPPAECARALHEVAADAEAMARDAEVLGLGLPPAARARALIRRDDDRMAERLARLPGPVAAEVRRLRACGIGSGDPAPSDPLCR